MENLPKLSVLPEVYVRAPAMQHNLLHRKVRNGARRHYSHKYGICLHHSSQRCTLGNLMKPHTADKKMTKLPSAVGSSSHLIRGWQRDEPLTGAQGVPRNCLPVKVRHTCILLAQNLTTSRGVLPGTAV